MSVVMVIAVAAVLVAVVWLASGRGGAQSVERPAYAPLDLGPVSATDVALLRPPSGLWGYNPQATDTAMEQIADAIRERDVRIVALEQLVTDLSRDNTPAMPLGSPYSGARHRRATTPGTGLTGPDDPAVTAPAWTEPSWRPPGTGPTHTEPAWTDLTWAPPSGTEATGPEPAGAGTPPEPGGWAGEPAAYEAPAPETPAYEAPAPETAGAEPAQVQPAWSEADEPAPAWAAPEEDEPDWMSRDGSRDNEPPGPPRLPFDPGEASGPPPEQSHD